MTRLDRRGVRRFDRTVRCEVQVQQRDEEMAAETFESWGWRPRRVGPGYFEVDIVVVGSRFGAARRAGEMLLDGLRRSGLVAELRSVICLDVPLFQRGDWLPVHRVRRSGWPWIERLWVGAGGRDTGHLIHAASVEQAEREMHLARGRIRDESNTLAWRPRFAQPRLPEKERVAPESVGRLFTMIVLNLGTGFAFGTIAPSVVSVLLGVAVLAVLGGVTAALFKVPGRAVTAVLLGGAGWLIGALLPPLPGVGWVYPLAILGGMATGFGVWHLLRDLSLGAQVSWLLPMTLPVVVPVTAAIGDLAYVAYLDTLGLPLESVTLGLWGRLAAAAGPVGLAWGVSLVSLGGVGWLRYFHYRVPTVLALPAALLYLSSSGIAAMNNGAAAAEQPGKGFVALQPSWVCVTPVEDKIPLDGGPLPAEPRPLLRLELAGSRLALWDPHRRPLRDGLIKVPADRVQAVRTTGENGVC